MGSFLGGAYHGLLPHEVLQLLGLVERRVERRALEPLVHLLLVYERRAALDTERECVVPKLKRDTRRRATGPVRQLGVRIRREQQVNAPRVAARTRPVQGRAIAVKIALVRSMQGSTQQRLELGMVVEGAVQRQNPMLRGELLVVGQDGDGDASGWARPTD